jgi:hypothetical protein
MDAQYDDFISVMTRAIVIGFDAWRCNVKFSGLSVMGVTAKGKPGCLQGDLSIPEMIVGSLNPVGRAIAAGVRNVWRQFQDLVCVPELPWYPTFASFPGATAPPTPNVPTPLLALGSLPSILSAVKLKDGMSTEFKGAVLFSEELFTSFASELEAAFTLWRNTLMVTGVMGSGSALGYDPISQQPGMVIGTASRGTLL